MFKWPVRINKNLIDIKYNFIGLYFQYLFCTCRDS